MRRVCEATHRAPVRGSTQSPYAVRSNLAAVDREWKRTSVVHGVWCTTRALVLRTRCSHGWVGSCLGVPMHCVSPLTASLQPAGHQAFIICMRSLTSRRHAPTPSNRHRFGWTLGVLFANACQSAWVSWHGAPWQILSPNKCHMCFSVKSTCVYSQITQFVQSVLVTQSENGEQYRSTPLMGSW